jgi:site-specific DNA-methyltransferase (adenine-specific)
MTELIHGDCLVEMQNIPDKSIDLIVTDPPYKIITGGDSNGANSERPKGILKGNIELMPSIPKFDDWIPECFRILKDDSHAYFMVNFTNLLEMGECLKRAGFKIHNLLVWEKNNCTPSQFYMKNCEYIFFCRKGKAKWITNIGTSKTVHRYDNVIGDKCHPTQKPISLMAFYIENSSKEGDVILDPFMGSGSTGVACVNTNRNFIGIELNEEYFKIAEKRINTAISEKESTLF